MYLRNPKRLKGIYAASLTTLNHKGASLYCFSLPFIDIGVFTYHTCSGVHALSHFLMLCLVVSYL